MKKETDTTNRLIRFLGGKTSYYVLGMVILLALIIYFFPSDFIYIQACWDYYRYYLAPIIVCADLILSFGTSHQMFKQAPFEEPVSHYCLCDYFIFIGAWKRMACSFS